MQRSNSTIVILATLQFGQFMGVCARGNIDLQCVAVLISVVFDSLASNNLPSWFSRVWIVTGGLGDSVNDATIDETLL